MARTLAKRAARRQTVLKGDPLRYQTIRMPASVWQKLRLLAAAKGSTSVGELRTAFDEYFEREWPKVRERGSGSSDGA